MVIIYNKTQSQSYISTHYSNNKIKTTATLFLHGYGGSERSERFMVKQALNKNVTNEVITARVSSEGKVYFDKKLNKDAANPIVKIEFKDNKNGNFKENAYWIKEVLSQLKSQFGIQQFNFVGHSMGNMSFAFYMKNYGDDRHLPQLKKEVNIAGVYNGVLNMNENVNEIIVDKQGKPSRMNPAYRQLLSLHKIYSGKEIEVLNIYGDLQDGSHSDGRVSNSSSQSLQYLLRGSAKSYQEMKFKGAKAQHSQLHENKDVANKIIQFLWET
ncbi:hypothetical protein HMPREF9955_0943 [Staphylococcus epidermidis FS1]|nr:hypothetical protein HMPREF9955_0943 [Staphylococcus epidermidis FS1]